ncbi:MAG: hypothetical protein QGD94_06405 [Planctomycetia bacterium]|nr:hypothetical protein [Planctomycetia bacterium]
MIATKRVYLVYSPKWTFWCDVCEDYVAVEQVLDADAPDILVLRRTCWTCGAVLQGPEAFDA